MPPKPTTPDEQKLKDFLSLLGLDPDQAKIYQVLIKHGDLTPLELSRKTTIPRTRVYRTLETMRHLKLVEEVIDEHRTLASAVPPDRLQKLLAVRQTELDQLTTLFPQIQTYLNQQINRRVSDTQVKFYRGLDGIKQMAENVLSAHKEIVGYTYLVWKSAVGEKYANYFFKEMSHLGLTMREIFSDTYIRSKGGIEKLAKSEVPVPYQNLFNSRYLSATKLDIQSQTDIYNDVVTFYSWTGEDIFGVEIYNHKVSSMQKQIFEILWSLATPYDDLLIKPTSKG